MVCAMGYKKFRKQIYGRGYTRDVDRSLDYLCEDCGDRGSFVQVLLAAMVSGGDRFLCRACYENLSDAGEVLRVIYAPHGFFLPTNEIESYDKKLEFGS